MLRLYTHPACLQHDPGPGHVERPARLHAVLRALDHDRFAALDRIEAPPATRDQLLRVHGEAHVREVLLGAPPGDVLALDPDTVMGPGSTEAALRAAGAAAAAV
ncbi:MAG: histone deacetylase family protein, partial [Rhodanobacter sp.]